MVAWTGGKPLPRAAQAWKHALQVPRGGAVAGWIHGIVDYEMGGVAPKQTEAGDCVIAASRQPGRRRWGGALLDLGLLGLLGLAEYRGGRGVRITLGLLIPLNWAWD